MHGLIVYCAPPVARYTGPAHREGVPPWTAGPTTANPPPGASGAIIINQGNTEERRGLINGTLTRDYAGGIPVVEATTSLGEEWALSLIPGLVMRLHANVFRGDVTAHSVLAESRDGADDNVVMAGAGLDSVDDGPGINDNGSGVAALLEVARQMAHVKPRNKVRFAFWAARQAGLIGSDEYVFGLPDEERAAIALYLNFDMIGSPNFAYFVYDGDGSAFGLAGPAGSGAIESFFQGFYEDRGLPYEETTIAFRSDYAAFFDVGIPFGGLFTGAEGVKTPAQAALFGGVAGLPFDPCWGLACDTFANVSLEALDVNSDAVAAAVLHHAMTTEAVNGQRGKGNFGSAGGPPAGAGPFRTSAPVR
ncbi:MAG TPA: M28 family peptidase [Longimicrobiales bacterium]|nr:M28 family peptidase [Longimicrobiales bacterium]